jgi:DNA-binding response OmpR family regulator
LPATRSRGGYHAKLPPKAASFNKEGEAIINAIRERDRTVPVIAVAERGDVSSAARAIAAGATDYLVRGGQLRERVTTLLAKVRALLELVQQNRVLGEQNRL